MFRKFLILVLFCSSHSSYSQSLYEDAVKLRQSTINNKLLSSITNKLNTLRREINKIKSDSTAAVSPLQLPAGATIAAIAAIREPYTKQLLAKYSEFGDIYKERDTLLTILVKYKFVTEDDIKDLKDRSRLNKSLKTNPYLEQLVATGELHSESSGQPKAIIESINSTLNQLGGLNVTTYSDALARLIVKRTKQELTTTFFKKFKEDLEDPRFSDLRILFPMTFRTLSAMGEEVYVYSAYLTSLREAFGKDLAQLTFNLPKVWEQDKYKPLLDRKPAIREYLMLATQLAEIMVKGKHPGDALHTLATESKNPANDTLITNYQSSLKFIDLFSQSLRTSNPEQYWVSKEEVNQLLKDSVLRRIFLGLVFEKEKEYQIQFQVKGHQVKLHNILKDSAKKILRNSSEILAFTEGLISDAKTIEYFLREVKSKEGKADAEELYRLFGSFLSLFERAFEIDQLPLMTRHLPSFKIPTEYRSSINAGQLLNECYLDIALKRYNSAIINGVALLDTVFTIINQSQRAAEIKNSICSLTKADLTGKVQKCKRRKVRRLASSLANAESQSERKAIAKKFRNNESLITNVNLKLKMKELADIIDSAKRPDFKKLMRYGTFAANLAAAKTSEEAEAAIEAIVLPTGSARIKRETRFNVALNAYCGLFAGTETIKGVDHHKQINVNLGSDWNSFGVSAPLGVAASWRLCKKKAGSISIFGSIVDLGALAAFRFTDDSTKAVPKVELKDIISPGVFVSYGIPKSPISFNVGYQFGPLLREVTKTENEIGSKYTRFSVSFCVDIPLLNFYTSNSND